MAPVLTSSLVLLGAGGKAPPSPASQLPAAADCWLCCPVSEGADPLPGTLFVAWVVPVGTFWEGQADHRREQRPAHGRGRWPQSCSPGMRERADRRAG